VIAVQLCEVLRDLALAERVIQRIVDQLRLDSEPRGLIPSGNGTNTMLAMAFGS
jgi:hypothetical protein